MSQSTHCDQRPAAVSLRRQIFVAPKAQGRVIYRVMLYCLLCNAMTAALYGLASWAFDEVPVAWLLIPVAGISMLLTLPLVVVDAAKISNRLIGPFVRAHGVIRRIADREMVPPVHVRDGEDWSEWFHDFNIMIKRVNPAEDAQKRALENVKQGERP